LRDVTQRLIKEEIPFVSVCLGHQILGSLLGFELVRKEMPNQGTQREVDFFSGRRRVGFYNTFALRCDVDHLDGVGVAGTVDVSRDADSGEVFGLRGPGFRSVQFHPESVLTENGPEILAELLVPLLRGTSIPALGGPTVAPLGKRRVIRVGSGSAAETSHLDVMRGDLAHFDVQLLSLVQKRTALAHQLGAARVHAGGTRFVYAAELSVVQSYRQLGPSGAELANLLLRLAR